MLMLVTGATGKVGRALSRVCPPIRPIRDTRIRALCHNRVLDETDRLEVVRGSIADRDVVERAMDGVTHVVHLATCKETPDDVMDITVKGMFWLLEAFRQSADRPAVHPDRRRRRRSAISSIATTGRSPKRRRIWRIPAAMRCRRFSRR